MIKTFLFTFMPKSCFTFGKEFSHEILPELLEKTKPLYVLPCLS